MVKSRTKRKSKDNISVNELKAVAEAASEYVKYWTRHEAHRLAKQELVLLPASWGLQVGKYAVKDTTLGWRVEGPSGDIINNFTSKRSAVTWCIMYQANRFAVSERLLAQDIRLMKLSQDRTNYMYKQQQARKKHDYFSFDVASARLTEITGHLESAKIDLEKTLNSAKYLKGIWEKPL